jgi:hypothetical protein
MPWGGFRHDGVVTESPAGWDPIIQLKRVCVNLGETCASWLIEHPAQVWDNREIFLARVHMILEKRSAQPAAIEALWDGDTSGWFLRLSAVVQLDAEVDRRFGLIHLGDFQAQDNIALARYLGEAVAERYGVPFFFPSPDKEEDDCPHWWQQDQAVHCSSCKVLIMSTFRDSGLCYRCYRQAEHQQGGETSPGH